MVFGDFLATPMTSGAFRNGPLRDWSVAICSHSADLPAEAWKNCWTDQAGAISVASYGTVTERYMLTWNDDVCAQIDFPRRRILIFDPSQSLPRPVVDEFISDVLAPRILSHLGNLVVHAATLKCGDGALAIAAPSGSGKSTLAGSLYGSGWQLLGDDAAILAVDGDEVTSRAINRRLHLRQDSFTWLAESIPAELTARPGRKIHVSLAEQTQLDQGAHRLAGIAFLRPGYKNQNEISLTRCSPSQACVMLISNSFALFAPDRERAVKRMQAASDLANTVPARYLDFPHDYSRLSEIKEILQDWLDCSPEESARSPVS